MAYATTADVQTRMTRTLSADELSVCAALLDDAAVLIDGCAVSASAEAKLVVSCRMVIRAIGDGGASGIPAGATQGQMSALGYSQSFTFGSGGGAAELYLSRQDRQILGRGNAIGSHSPVEDLVPAAEEETAP